MISFIILTYNHEKYIQTCLSSIKHQIKSYGNNHKFQLIIGNDCSKDKTVDIIKNWLKSNDRLFEDFVLLDREVNLGTCENYIDSLRYVKGKYIKAIAGDDFLPLRNIIEVIELLDNYDVVYGLPFIYQQDDNKIEVNIKEFYSNYCYERGNSKKSFNTRIERNCFLCAPATYASKELLMHPDVLKYLKKFKYIDDYSQWYMFSRIKKIDSLFVNDFTIVYRRTNNSTFIIKNEALKNEKLRIYREIRKKSDNLFNKIYQTNNIIATMNGSSFAEKYLNYENYKLFAYKKRYCKEINREMITHRVVEIIDYINKIM